MCAAEKFTFLNNVHPPIIICGIRHGDDIISFTLGAIDKRLRNKIVNVEQGFVDSLGNFLNRHEALVVAAVADQLVSKTQPVDRLFSEDLW